MNKTQMNFKLLASLVLASQIGFASEITDVFKTRLPDKLSLLSIGDSLAHTKQLLGRPDTADGKDNFFYNLTGRDYDTTVGFTDGSVRYILYKFGPNELKLDDIKSFIPKDAVKLDKKISSSDPDEEAYYSIDLYDQGLRIEVLDNEKHTIRSVLKWQPGESTP